MQPFSQTFGYAVLALSCLARSCRGRVDAPSIAACSGVPLPYLRKILHQLAGHGLVVTQRGRDGGATLARDTHDITLWDVARAVEPTVSAPRCIMGLNSCSDEHACPMHDVWKVQRAQLEARLRELTLASVAEHEWHPDALAHAASASRDMESVNVPRACADDSDRSVGALVVPKRRSV